ncbi:hypothetical protein MATR_03780 [Marivirga tractuosa]|uniref:Uncharacterized protein n=1 Tax=Marivirga tractuosa (strain ATCC 23168 / DSM 4126 / NBRC 15989 / NCIMB 1408 / VKM B-1430 / H-43) TaxID=643867 RepID=E4TTT2_MARTH|nr:DUF4105 domain-containing protein [Marivirga tractuosa]ADR21987.1 hypothetical protein Ftrac_2002 [Marivirga tractuosa DSM 4126]BDD13553.1 hypothetical protein MATR_03780 [Marivirga tractuosa]
MIKELLLGLLMFASVGAFGQTRLSEMAEMSLITVAPGDELYSGFGHSALWIEDESTGLSVVFNYGTFDFDTPGFYMKFVRGKLDYMLSAGRLSYLVNSAKAEKRTVIQQKLSLSIAQKNEIYNFLLNNIKPENRFYQYDFFFDNCSTRFRDLLEDVLGEGLVWERDAEGLTFREYLDIYLANKPWQDFGIDLVLGQPTDEIADKRNEMFLPDMLMMHFDEATYNGKPIVEDKIIIYEAEEEQASVGFQILPEYVTWFLCLFGIFLSVRHHKSKLSDVWFNRLLFIITGLVGCLIFFLWFLSDHMATVNNWNMIWAFPLNVVLAFLLFKKPAKKWHTAFYAIFGIFQFMVLGFFYTLPQAMHVAVLPIVLYFAFKSFNLLYRTKKMNT